VARWYGAEGEVREWYVSGTEEWCRVRRSGTAQWHLIPPEEWYGAEGRAERGRDIGRGT
jgi:hypothetical protein